MRATKARHALSRLAVACLAALSSAALLSQELAPSEIALRQKADPWVLETSRPGPTECLIVLAEQADLRPAACLATKAAKGAFVLNALREVADRTQGPLLADLKALGAEARPYWIVNMVWVRAGRPALARIAGRADVARLAANPSVTLHTPDGQAASAAEEASDVEWNVTQVGVPEVWAMGYTGQGAVVAGQDTGYRWKHKALKAHYRGWDGSAASHDYNWHDAVHAKGGSCGHDAKQPCDDSGHGTHTMGTMVGDDGKGNQIGLAPGARWIGCRNMDRGAGSPSTYSECFQWFLAPTDGSGQNPDPTKAPDVINNSWGCPASEGCTDPEVLRGAVEAARAAGIVVVVSAGNAGPLCGTVNDAPAIYEASFSVGATDDADVAADFSSRGPVTLDGSGRLKPDVSAPGVAIRSSYNATNKAYAMMSGTSMAGPHVAGLVALILSARPDLAGQVDRIEDIIRRTCVPLTTSDGCGGDTPESVPNHTYGWGRIDALAAVNAALSEPVAPKD
jgi:serine protease AprX